MYDDFLKLLRTSPSKRCSCPSHLHPKNWIHPPCLSSKPTQFDHTRNHRRSHSSPLLGYEIMPKVTSCPQRKNTQNENLTPLDDDDICIRFKQIERDLIALKDAQRKLENEDELSDSTKELVLEWKNKYPQDDLTKKTKPSSPKKDRLPLNDTSPIINIPPVSSKVTSMFKRLEVAAKEAQCEERAASATRKIAYDLHQRALEMENRKLKKKLKSLSYLKSREQSTLDMEHERYKRSALKRKYEDLMKHLRKLEAENASLKLKKKRRTEYFEGEDAAARELPHSNGLIVRGGTSQAENDVKYVAQHNAPSNSENGPVQAKKAIDDVDAFTSVAYSQAQKDREKKWQDKVSQMEEIYENVIRGYKDQLNKKQEQFLLLQDQREQEVRHLMKREQEASQKHENDVQRLHARMSSLQSCNREETFRLQQSRIINLEKIVGERDAQIDTLKLSIEKQVEVKGLKELVGEMEGNIMCKMQTLVKEGMTGNSSEKSQASLIKSFREIFKESLLDWKHTQETSQHLIDGAAAIPTVATKVARGPDGRIYSNTDVCHSCEEYKGRIDNLVARGAYLEVQVEEGKKQTSIEKDAVQRLTRLNEELQHRLLEGESKERNSDLREKLLSERLDNCIAELEQGKDQIEVLDKQLTLLNHERQQLAVQMQSQDEKKASLEREIKAKNDLLSLNSAQLEERIRENANLFSQTKRLKEENSKEADVYKSGEHTMQAQLGELHSQNERLKTQLSNFRRDKERLERSFKTQAKSFEEKIHELTLKSATHQKQFETISNSYKSIFGGREWSLLPQPASASNLNINNDAS